MQFRDIDHYNFGTLKYNFRWWVSKIALILKFIVLKLLIEYLSARNCIDFKFIVSPLQFEYLNVQKMLLLYNYRTKKCYSNFAYIIEICTKKYMNCCAQLFVIKGIHMHMCSILLLGWLNSQLLLQHDECYLLVYILYSCRWDDTILENWERKAK